MVSRKNLGTEDLKEEAKEGILLCVNSHKNWGMWNFFSFFDPPQTLEDAEELDEEIVSDFRE